DRTPAAAPKPTSQGPTADAPVTDPVTDLVTGSPAGPVAPELLAALRRIRMSEDLRSATVGDRTVRADDPRDLQPQLGAVLYDVLHSGRAHEEKVRLTLREPAFETELRAAVPHEHIVRPATVLASRLPARPSDSSAAPAERPGAPAEERVLVAMDQSGVRVRVPASALVGQDGPAPEPGSLVRVRLAPYRPALSPGFFYVFGTREPEFGDDLLRVYVHLADARSAVAAWAAVLERLEAAGAHYHAKVLSTPYSYPRRDALVVYLGRESWAACHEVAGTVRDLPGVAPDTSAFAHRLGPGAAIAWEPADPRPGNGRLSFGQHRAGALAEAAVAAARQGLLPLAGPGGDAATGRGMSDSDATTGSEALASVVAEAFRAAGADPAAPFRNIGSPPVPPP
ncbi:T3SS effector HopA1 family protein, partial [Streptomyces sp. URMC 123]|uniref:T3SS effector HopA1 family protein n=1 Tax=Streptomyces sp. URMC 123 TaxID=3423403 RepID=UPI003F195B5E